MIAKLSTAVNISGGLTYNINKIERGEAYILCGSRIPFGSADKGETHKSEILEEFFSHLEVLHFRGRTKNPIVHISLNPSSQDKVDDITYSYMAQDYLEEMGFGHQPFVVFKHEDIERHHIHILTTNVRANGTKIEDSFSKRRSVKACEKLEREYGLTPAKGQDKSIIQHVGYSSDNYRFSVENANAKAQIKRIANYVSDKYHFQSEHEYKALMRIFGLDTQFVKDTDGKNNKGIVFCGLSSYGDHVTEPIEAKFVQRGLLKKIEKKIISFKTRKALADSHTQNFIKSKLDIVKAAVSRIDFYQKLAEQNMDIAFRQNDVGRIYGATIVDHDSGLVLNGSKLGKPYSANVFNELLDLFDTFNAGGHVAGGHVNQQQQQQAGQEFYSVGQSGGSITFGGYAGGLAHYERVGEKTEESETDKLNRKIKKRKKRKKNS